MAEKKPPVMEHASRPGLYDFILMAAGLIGSLAIAYSEPLKRFFGIE